MQHVSGLFLLLSPWPLAFSSAGLFFKRLAACCTRHKNQMEMKIDLSFKKRGGGIAYAALAHHPSG